MIPAHALSEELRRRGHTILLLTDERGQRFPGLFEDVLAVRVDSATSAAGGIVGRLKMIPKIISGICKARTILKEFAPDMVVGFGGYPAFPTLCAARLAGYPYCLHEQNAVLGRVNRLMAGAARMIALSFPNTLRIPEQASARTCVSGNPVRDEILSLRSISYAEFQGNAPVHLLVVGGSQGASIFSRVVPPALAVLPEEIRNRLVVRQQCREDDVASVSNLYRQAGISAEVAKYFEDIATCLSEAHLVVCRAGASTVSELTVSGRPAILVPYAAAMDDHQAENARELIMAGGAWMLREREFTVESLKAELIHIFATQGALLTASARARETARPDAARDLADLVEQYARGNAEVESRKSDQPEQKPTVMQRVSA